MKQKQVKGSPKMAAKQTKATKKAPPPKKVEVVEDATDEEEVPVKKVVVQKKPTNKKSTKIVEVEVVPEEEEEEEEVEEQEEEMEEQEEEMEEQDEEMEDEEIDDQDDDHMDDEENDEEDDEEIEADEDNEDNESGEEEPTIPSKVKTGEIPSSVPASKIVHVGKLPKKFKKIDIIEIFGKYGAIDQIHTVINGGSVANIAFKTEKAATAALAANNKVKVLNNFILVSKYTKTAEKKPKSKINESRERSVYVRYLKAGTTEHELRAHFEGCGELERVKLVNKFNTTFAFITFTDKSSKEAALKLHNSLLNDVNIGVCENNENPTQVGLLYDEKLTIMMKNKQNLEGVEVSKIESIFSKCGEIEAMDIVCKKNILAFITFKTEQAAQKAVKLNGKTEQGIELQLELYNPYSKKTTIYVSNLPKACTEEDLVTCFSRAGEISNIFHKGVYAIIRFVDSDAYCKSFLFHESFIKKQMIFVEPLSIRKKAIMKFKQPKNFQKKGFKRSAPNGNGVFRSKKARAN